MHERTIARLATARGRRVWLVGGPVRDRLLGRVGGDVDLALDGAVREIGRAAARELGGSFRWHARFLTGRIDLAAAHLDVARTRRETYASPGALPQVRPAGIEEDLARRDFTINAMALEIRPRGRGRLLDPFSGRADLQSGVVRVLHERSFVDDPTRAYRALRFAVRLGFRLDRPTRRRMRAAIDERLHHRLSGERVATELRLALAEPQPAAVLTAFSRFGLDSFWNGASVARRLRYAPARLARLDAAPGVLFGCAFGDLRRPARERLARRLRLTRGEKRALIEGPSRARALLRRLRTARGRARLDAVCSATAPLDVILAALLADAPTHARIRGWWRGSRTIELQIDGNDLRAAGMKPGPGIARALAAARAALLEGRAFDRESQLAVALRA